MPTCYNCGRKIDEGTGVRKEVYTGRSGTTGIFGKRFGNTVAEKFMA